MTVLVGRGAERLLVIAALRAGRDLLLEGPAGTGKSLLVREVAGATGRHVTVVEGSAAVTTGALLGHHEPAAVLRAGFAGASFVDGPLLVAMRHGRLLHLEEANRLPADTLDLLLGPLSERRIAVPRVGTVSAAPGFRVIATVNDDDPSGTRPLGRAFGERLVRLCLGHQRAEEERAIVRGHVPDAPAWLVRASVGVARSTRDHPDLLRGASVRGSIDLLLVARQLAVLEAVDLHERGPLTLGTVRRAALVALSGRVTVRASCGRSAEEVIGEVWDGEVVLRPAAAGPATGPPSDLVRSGPARRARPASGSPAAPASPPRPDDVPGDGPAVGGSGPLRPAAAERGGTGADGHDAGTAASPGDPTVDDDALDDLVEIAADGRGRAARRGHRQRLAGTDPRLVQRLAVQIIVERARSAARGRRGPGRLRAARFRFQSDDLDLDRSLEEIVANPYPGHEDFWVQERSAGRRAVVLMVDVSGSMRGAPLVRAALAAASASVAAEHDDLATVLFWSRTLLVTSVDNPRPLVRVVEDVLAVRPEGLTDVAQGLTAGLRELDRSRARERLGILVTDGVSNHGSDPERTARLFPRLHVLSTASTPRRLLTCRRLATAGHGECVSIPEIADIPAALTRCLGGGDG